MPQSLADLQDHLFAALDRLDAAEGDPERMQAEIKRAGAVVNVADQIAGIASLQLQAAKLYAVHRDAVLPMLPQIGKPAPAATDPKEPGQ